MERDNKITEFFINKHLPRLNTLIEDLIIETMNRASLHYDPNFHKAKERIKDYIFQEVIPEVVETSFKSGVNSEVKYGKLKFTNVKKKIK